MIIIDLLNHLANQLYNTLATGECELMIVYEFLFY